MGEGKNPRFGPRVAVKMESPYMKTRQSVVDSNKLRVHVIIYMVSTKGKARKCIATKLIYENIE